jgi:phage baseplate assembly protein V
MKPADAARRLMNMVSRAIVTAIDDSPKMQVLQAEMLEGELADGIEHFQPYGLRARPFAEGEAIIVCPSGTRSHAIAIVVGDRRYRVALEEGEVALFDDQEQSVKLARDGIRLNTTLKVFVDADEVNLNANKVTVTSNTVLLGGVGGAKVARVGDLVVDGVITTGSSKVKAL